MGYVLNICLLPCISIHALREESDILLTSTTGNRGVFQSTLSVRRATLNGIGWVISEVIISIHALREESDLAKQKLCQKQNDFNPRSP